MMQLVARQDASLICNNMAVVHFETLGCRLNQDETEGAAHSFFKSGFETDLENVTAKTLQNDQVVLCIVNTCTVTTKAEQKARRIIRLLLEKFPRSLVIVTGCYAELDGPEIVKIDPARICIIRGSQKSLLNEIPSLYNGTSFDMSDVNNFISSKSSLSIDKFSLFTPVFRKHSRASIKIQDGCNNECSFCRIHLARGKAQSLSPQEILSRVKTMEKEGVSEIVFTGVNLSQYAGKSSDGKTYSFCDLLSYILENTEMVKFRISSFYPQHVTQELAEVLASDRVQPFFHLSIQSGSDRILSLMKRPYKMHHVISAVEILRKYKSNPFISCDIIAGFPGETDEDFDQTKALCSQCHFSWVHAFPYSPRPGTAAYSMKPKIPERIKDERVQWLNGYACNEKINYIKAFAGKTVCAVVEKSRAQRLSLVSKNIYHGVTDNFIHVEFVSEKFIPQGSIVSVRIKEPIENNILEGREIEAKAQLV